MYCKKCGAEIKEGGKFCENCGTKVATVTYREENGIEEIKPKEVENGEVVAPKKKLLKSVMRVIGIICGVIFILGLYGIYQENTPEGKAQQAAIERVQGTIVNGYDISYGDVFNRYLDKPEWESWKIDASSAGPDDYGVCVKGKMVDPNRIYKVVFHVDDTTVELASLQADAKSYVTKEEVNQKFIEILSNVVDTAEAKSVDNTELHEKTQNNLETKVEAMTTEESAEDMKLDYIFPTDVQKEASWYSGSTGYYMIPYMEGDIPTILFASENVMATYAMAFFADMTDVKRTENGGLDCRGTIYVASNEEPIAMGEIEVIWDSMETVDFPTVKMVSGNQLTDTSMVASDYTYYGFVEEPSGAVLASREILPDSSIRLITDADVAELSEEELRIATNEIYARHGRRFKDAELQAYFDSQSWYDGTVEPSEFNEDVLSQIEKDNIKFLTGK